MNVLYDLIYFEKEKHGGISRMWLEYFKLLPENQIKASYLTKPGITNIAHDHLSSVDYYNYPVIHEKKFNSPKLNKLTQLGFYRNLALLKLIPKNSEIFHSTDYINPIVKSNNLKIITTIHDMVFWDQNDKFKKNIWYWDKVFCIYHALKISDQIITVSESSKNSIIKQYPWSEKKLNVVYHGLSDQFLKLNILPDKEQYFMFIGGRNDYKNYDLLLNAFSEFIKRRPDWKLHVVGQNEHTLDVEKKRYEELGIDEQVVDHGLVDDRRLLILLQKASALVIPSLNEGFNFPLLEAMASGCPVLSSDIPVSKEIGKNYVTYFSNDKDVLLNKMVDISNHQPDINNITEAQKYSRTFNWKNSFEKLLNVYEKCL